MQQDVPSLNHIHLCVGVLLASRRSSSKVMAARSDSMVMRRGATCGSESDSFLVVFAGYKLCWLVASNSGMVAVNTGE